MTPLFSHSNGSEPSRLAGSDQAPTLSEIDEITGAIIERLLAVAPTIRDHQLEAEDKRALPDASYRALRDTGALHVAIPRRYGGYETSAVSQLKVSAAVGAIDGSAAWVTALNNVSAWSMSMFGPRAQEEVFGDPECSFCGVLAPTGVATPVEGGCRVSGKWFYASSSAHAKWANIAVQLKEKNGNLVDIAGVLLPRRDYQVEDTWFTSGMRATASNAIVVDDVYVPAHRVASLRAAVQGMHFSRYDGHPLYRSAVGPMLSLMLVGPQLGLGRAALDYVVEKAGVRPIAYTAYARQSDSVGFQLQIARAATKVETAHLHAYRAAEDIDAAARRGVHLDVHTRARVRADCAVALESINEALNQLLFAHGASSFSSASPLQRIWRDSNIAARHAVMLPELNYEIYGKVLLGLEHRVVELTPAL